MSGESPPLVISHVPCVRPGPPVCTGCNDTYPSHAPAAPPLPPPRYRQVRGSYTTEWPNLIDYKIMQRNYELIKNGTFDGTYC